MSFYLYLILQGKINKALRGGLIIYNKFSPKYEFVGKCVLCLHLKTGYKE